MQFEPALTLFIYDNLCTTGLMTLSTFTANHIPAFGAFLPTACCSVLFTKLFLLSQLAWNFVLWESLLINCIVTILTRKPSDKNELVNAYYTSWTVFLLFGAPAIEKEKWLKLLIASWYCRRNTLRKCKLYWHDFKHIIEEIEIMSGHWEARSAHKSLLNTVRISMKTYFKPSGIML